MRALAFVLLGLLLTTPVHAQSPSLAPTSVIAVVIATGNTYQAVTGLTAGSQRRSLTIQNNNITTDNCWVFLGTLASATKATSILLAPGQSYSRYYPFVPSDAVNVTCATTSNTMYVDIQ